MRNRVYLFLAALLVIGFLGTGCSKTKLPGGDPTPIGTVGNAFTGYLVGLSNFSALVTQNEDGIATIQCLGTVTDPNILEFAPYLNSSSMASINEVTGEFSVNLKVKFTTDGVADFYASDGKGSTLVNYDAKVGDEYKCKNADGESFTREVTRRSETDDWFYGFLLIKTITIEEPIGGPVLNKVVYEANHRFGIVNIKAVLQDGTEYSFALYSENEN